MSKKVMWVLVLFLLFFTMKAAVGNSDPLGLADYSTILFVDMNNTNCSNTYARATALDPNSPWCNVSAVFSTSSTTPSKMQYGDTLYFRQGSYNFANSYLKLLLNGTGSDTNTTISAYPGDEVNFTGHRLNYTVANNLWANISSDVSDTFNFWYTNATLETTYGTPHSIWLNSTYMMIHSRCFYNESGCMNAPGSTSEYNHWILNNSPVRANWSQFYYNTTSDKIYIRIPNGTNPNNIPIYISDEGITFEPYKHNATGYLIIQNLTFRYSRVPLNIKQCNNTIIRYNRFYGGQDQLNYDANEKGNVNIYGNYFDNQWSPDDTWYTILIKDAYMELGALNLGTEIPKDVWIHNNTFYHIVDGLSTQAGNDEHNCNITVEDNYFETAYGSFIEIEGNICNGTYRNNIANDTHNGISINFGCRNDEGMFCRFYNNQIWAGNKTITDEDSIYASYPLKIYKAEATTNISGWNFTNNYFSGNMSWYMIAREYYTENNWTLFNLTVMQNIFHAGSDRVAYTGDSENGTHWDYNIYFQESRTPSYQMFNGYDRSDCQYCYHDNLSAAMASAYWNGVWDLNSQEGYYGYDKEFTQTDRQLYSLLWNSTAIDKGFTTSYRTTDALGNPIYGTPDVGAIEYQPPWNSSSDKFNLTSSHRIYSDSKYRWKNLSSGTTLANLKVENRDSPSFAATDTRPFLLDLIFTVWNTSTDYHKRLSLNGTQGNLSLTIGDVLPSQWSRIKLNGTYNQSRFSDSTGNLTFNVSGSVQDLTVTIQPFNLTMIDGTTNITRFYLGDAQVDNSTAFQVNRTNATEYHIRNLQGDTINATLNFTLDNVSITCTNLSNITYTSDTGAYSYLFVNSTNISCLNGYVTLNITGIEYATGSNKLVIGALAGAGVDSTAPVITAVLNSSITDSSVTISWTTDDNSNSTVHYGLTAALGSIETSGSLTTSHSLGLSGLAALTLYYYNVSSCNSDGYCNRSIQYNFTTINITVEEPNPSGLCWAAGLAGASAFGIIFKFAVVIVIASIIGIVVMSMQGGTIDTGGITDSVIMIAGMMLFIVIGIVMLIMIGVGISGICT